MQSQSSNFMGLSWNAHGKGYLVHPAEGYTFTDSDKYYHGGWWMPSQSAWFFKKDAFDKFLKGDHINKKEFAKQITDDVDRLLSKQSKDYPLRAFNYSPYKKGYCLYFREDVQGTELAEFPKDYKYFHGAWWMEMINSWFFRADVLESIRAKGAREPHEEMIEIEHHHHHHHNFEESSEDSSVEYDDANDGDYVPSDEEMISDDDDTDEEIIDLRGLVTYNQYGKGWLVKPNNKCRINGQKYLNGGWWMPKKQGWFFRNEEFQMLGLHRAMHE